MRMPQGPRAARRLGRYVLTELTAARLWSALKVRALELPHALAWSTSGFAQANRESLGSYMDRHRGERCVIVANGPSLAKTNLDSLGGEFTFGLNRIYLNFDRSSFRPTYYLAMNELILEQFASEIARLAMPKFLNWSRRSYYQNAAGETLFLKSRMVLTDTFQADVRKPLVVGGTVTFVALQLAYFMGFQTVILVGLDHSYVERGTPSGTETRTAERDESHFHPDYFPKGSRWQLPDLLRSELDFSIARRAFEADGRRIVDATIGGQCPVFDRRDLATALGRSGVMAAGSHP